MVLTDCAVVYLLFECFCFGVFTRLVFVVCVLGCYCVYFGYWFVGDCLVVLRFASCGATCCLLSDLLVYLVALVSVFAACVGCGLLMIWCACYLVLFLLCLLVARCGVALLIVLFRCS